MNFVRLTLSQNCNYSYLDASNTQMSDLGMFLAYDFDCSWSSFGEWATSDSLGDCVSGNITRLEKDNEYILLSDLYNEKENQVKLKMTRSQFIKILDDWCDRIIKKRPKEVTIIYDGNQFIIETHD
jgi:hypothetical protein